jgi:hypothetical protein
MGVIGYLKTHPVLATLLVFLLVLGVIVGVVVGLAERDRTTSTTGGTTGSSTTGGSTGGSTGSSTTGGSTSGGSTPSGGNSGQTSGGGSQGGGQSTGSGGGQSNGPAPASDVTTTPPSGACASLASSLPSGVKYLKTQPLSGYCVVTEWMPNGGTVGSVTSSTTISDCATHVQATSGAQGALMLMTPNSNTSVSSCIPNKNEHGASNLLPGSINYPSYYFGLIPKTT